MKYYAAIVKNVDEKNKKPAQGGLVFLKFSG